MGVHKGLFYFWWDVVKNIVSGRFPSWKMFSGMQCIFAAANSRANIWRIGSFPWTGLVVCGGKWCFYRAVKPPDPFP